MTTISRQHCAVQLLPVEIDSGSLSGHCASLRLYTKYFLSSPNLGDHPSNMTSLLQHALRSPELSIVLLSFPAVRLQMLSATRMIRVCLNSPVPIQKYQRS